MERIKNLLNTLLGRIYLKKAVFFGVVENKIFIIIGPTLKIYHIAYTPEKLRTKFPFEDKAFLDLIGLRNWAQENDYTITFSAPTTNLRKKLARIFGNVMIESRYKRRKNLDLVVMEELNKSTLPDAIKKWAKDNPEKFAKNVTYIQELLKE